MKVSFTHQYSNVLPISMRFSLLVLTIFRPLYSLRTVTMAFSKINAAENLMKQVYGNWDELLDKKLFPRPLPAQEAGPSCVKWGNAGDCQRRYLWTVAFGVLNFVTLSKRHPERKNLYLSAAKELIAAVHQSLGQPRAAQFPMAPNVNSPGFKGLRIGKEEARKMSDPGMNYDGMSHDTSSYPPPLHQPIGPPSLTYSLSPPTYPPPFSPTFSQECTGIICTNGFFHYSATTKQATRSNHFERLCY